MTTSIGVQFEGTDLNAGTAAATTLAVTVHDKVVCYTIGSRAYIINLRA